MYVICGGLLLFMKGRQVLLRCTTHVNVFTHDPQSGRLTQVFEIGTGKAGCNMRKLIQLEARRERLSLEQLLFFAEYMLKRQSEHTSQTLVRMRKRDASSGILISNRRGRRLKIASSTS